MSVIADKIAAAVGLRFGFAAKAAYCGQTCVVAQMLLFAMLFSNMTTYALLLYVQKMSSKYTLCVCVSDGTLKQRSDRKTTNL